MRPTERVDFTSFDSEFPVCTGRVLVSYSPFGPRSGPRPVSVGYDEGELREGQVVRTSSRHGIGLVFLSLGCDPLLLVVEIKSTKEFIKTLIL